MAKGDARSIRCDVVDSDIRRLEQDLPAGGEPHRNQVLDHFLLTVDRDRTPAGQRRKVDAVSLAAEAQLDAAVNQALPAHALAHACLVEQVHAALFEHTGAYAVLDVVATAVFDDDRLDAIPMQQMR